MKLSKIHDVTLRDGNHALRHKLSIEVAIKYAKMAYESGIQSIEIGHGNGLGASSGLIGFSEVQELTMLEKVREAIPNAFLGVHSIPSFSTIDRNILPAIKLGVDSFRIAAHCTEMDTTRKHIEFIRDQNKIVTGTLMMITHAKVPQLIEESKKLVEYGAQRIVFMDSVGGYTPNDVKDLMQACSNELSIPFGFHAHNNLNLAVWNSIMALQSGGSFVDASILGLGAGAGNAQLENMVAVMKKIEIDSNLEFIDLIKLANFSEKYLDFPNPLPTTLSIASSYCNLFSGFLPIIKNAAGTHKVSEIDLVFSLTALNLVAGQEDLIYKKASEISRR
jgi:4-hydroxy 2-oxovalerate aldolase